MTPVNQTTFGTQGNCARACIASMLDLPIEQVPSFPLTDVMSHWDAIEEYVGSMGYDIRYLPDHYRPGISEYYLASGPTGRSDLSHMVVMLGENLAHDPHPDKTGIQKINYRFKLEKEVIADKPLAAKPPAIPAQLIDREPSRAFEHQPGQILGGGYPCYPEDATTFRERLMYQRGIADARYLDKRKTTNDERMDFLLQRTRDNEGYVWTAVKARFNSDGHPVVVRSVMFDEIDAAIKAAGK